jgi:hypothetical protein
MPAMALRRFRFTIRQMIKLIALCAFCFAVLRTPFAPLIVAIGGVLPGFILSRANGGTGIRGGTLCGCLVFITYGIGTWILDSHPSEATLPLFVFLLLAGAIWGAFVSILLYCAIRVTKPLYQKPLRGEACGPIVWLGFDDRPGPGMTTPARGEGVCELIVWLDSPPNG